jgi:hypothetical protein
MTSLPVPGPTSATHNRLVTILAAVVAISGVGELLAAAHHIAGSPALVFLVSGFGALRRSVPLTEMALILLGLATVGAAVGIWGLRSWGYG